MNSSKNHSFLKENKKRETSTPECSHTHNQTNIHHLNTDKTNNKLNIRKRCLLPTSHPDNKVVLRLYKSNDLQKTTCDLLGDSEKLSLPQKIMRVDAIYLTKIKTQKNKNKNSTFHRVCNVHNTPLYFDQNRSKTYKNNHTTLLSLIKHTYYTILTLNNMFTCLYRFILHLFISITNLLFIYSLLCIFLLVYIIYYLSFVFRRCNKKR